MPIVSKSQQGWMFANKPAMAKRWAAETPDFAGLPQHVDDGDEKKKAKLGALKALMKKKKPSPY